MKTNSKSLLPVLALAGLSMLTNAQSSVMLSGGNSGKKVYDTTTAQPGVPWLDETIVEQNRMPMHASYFVYENDKVAAKNDWKLAANYYNLNGAWKFKWVEKPADLPADFESPDLDDSQWKNFTVPGKIIAPPGQRVETRAVLRGALLGKPDPNRQNLFPT